MSDGALDVLYEARGVLFEGLGVLFEAPGVLFEALGVLFEALGVVSCGRIVCDGGGHVARRSSAVSSRETRRRFEGCGVGSGGRRVATAAPGAHNGGLIV